MPELVIFDCDGVLVDSEVLSARVARDMAAEHGVQLAREEALEFIRGRRVAQWVAELEQRAGRGFGESFVPEFRTRTAAAFDRELHPVPGVAQVLATLDVPYCVASSAPMDKIRHELSLTGLLHYVDGRLYSAYDHRVWKPDPGLFLQAAADFGCPPERCAVVEDSPVGVRAGRRAGMAVFGYATGSAAAVLAAEGATPFPEMARLPGLLRAQFDRTAARIPAGVH